MRLSISIAFLFRCRGSPPAAPRPDAIRCAFARLAINRGGAIRPQVSATLTTVKDGTGLWSDDARRLRYQARIGRWALGTLCGSSLQAEQEYTANHERRAQEVKRRHAFAEPKKRP